MSIKLFPDVSAFERDASALNTRPAGPVGGLETVGATYMGYFYKVSGKAVWPVNAQELVTRSQAEAIIAAERSEQNGWKRLHDAAQRVVKDRTEACNSLHKQVKDLEADNAELTARVKELEGWKELHGAAQRTVKERTQACNSLYEQVNDLETKLAAARKALEWYANPEIYKPHPHGPAFDNRDVSYVARAALEDRP